MGLLWYPVRTFTNYSLKVDWMMPGDDNGGVFIGFPDPLGDPWSPVNRRTRSRSTPPTPTRRAPPAASTASRRPNAAARDAALNPPGSWNTYEIGVHGQRVEIWLNGVKINDYTSTRNIANGYIGVQNDGAGVDINYRNIRIKTDGGAARADRRRPGQADHGVQRGGGQRARRRRTRSTATPPPAGAAPTPTRSGSRSTSAQPTPSTGSG